MAAKTDEIRALATQGDRTRPRYGSPGALLLIEPHAAPPPKQEAPLDEEIRRSGAVFQKEKGPDTLDLSLKIGRRR